MEKSALLPRPRPTRATWESLPLPHRHIGALPPPLRRKRRRLRRKWFWSRCTERERRRRKASPRLVFTCTPPKSHLFNARSVSPKWYFDLFLLDAFHRQTFSKCLKSLETCNTVRYYFIPQNLLTGHILLKRSEMCISYGTKNCVCDMKELLEITKKNNI